jgi:hypothetical protein
VKNQFQRKISSREKSVPEKNQFQRKISSREKSVPEELYPAYKF